jgi:hypothetical protein
MQLVNDVPPPLERLVGHRSWSPSLSLSYLMGVLVV